MTSTPPNNLSLQHTDQGSDVQTFEEPVPDTLVQTPMEAPAESQTFQDDAAGKDDVFSGLFDLTSTRFFHNDIRPDGLTSDERIKLIQVSRRFAVLDWISKQSIRLYTDFALGSGVSVQIGKKEDKKAQDVIDAFMSELSNAKHLSPVGMRKNSDRLLIDGNWFIVLQQVEIGEIKIRNIDTLDITKIITNPVDKDEVWFYQRETFAGGNINKKRVKRLYRDISIADKDLSELLVPDKTPDGKEKTDAAGKTVMVPWTKPNDAILMEDSVVHHVSINSTGIWGNPILTTSMNWSREFRRFMESRIAIQQHRASIVRKETVKGGKAIIDQRKNLLNSSLSTSNSRETNPPSAPGGTWIGSQGIDFENVEQKTAAQDAKIDADLLLMVAGVATGIFPQWYGVESQRLATQRSIEAPMLKAFRNYQQVFASALTTVFNYVLNRNKIEVDKIDLDFPPMMEKERKELLETIEIFVRVFPQFATSTELQSLAVATVGLNNPEDIVEEANKAAPQTSQDDMGEPSLARDAVNALKKFAEKEDLINA